MLTPETIARLVRRFSALQRAENSSIVEIEVDAIPLRRVSVLFSEPKIPQFFGNVTKACARFGFSALQRAENSSIFTLDNRAETRYSFSALQRAENSSMQSCRATPDH